MSSIIQLNEDGNRNCPKHAQTVPQLESQLNEAIAAAMACVVKQAAREEVSFKEVEQLVRDAVFAIGRGLLVLFLGLREEHLLKMEGNGKRLEWTNPRHRKAPPIGRNLKTLFGVVRYHRTYMREVAGKDRHGFHPLDLSLGLGSDRFSWNLLSVAVRLATKLSFAEARSTMAIFVPQTPSTEVIEQAVLGFARHTEAWLDQAPVAHDDGDVLVVQIDGKGAPMATDEELKRRRGKRRRSKTTKSSGHRGRHKRAGSPKKPRRKKGDKSKNAKMATMVVMYTMRRVGARRLEGPVNRWVYASFAPKRHAFEIARRMANKRGFTDGNKRLVQLVTDGDNDLARLSLEFFPRAEHTVDYYHVCEYLWTAGACFHKEGSDELYEWVSEQKRLLFADKAEHIVAGLGQRLETIARTGPGNKGRRDRLRGVIRYLEKRLANIRYGALRRRDLELGSGAVEGAVKHVIGRRCDHGGMRWIKERAEAILQLRCIEVNGQWELFESFVHHRMQARGLSARAPQRLQTNSPAPLPLAA